MAYFVVEGNIGAGKSTFMRVVGSLLNAQIVYEPHEAWQNIGGENLLDAFYKDGNRWAYTFQTYAFITRIFALEEHIKNTTNPYLLCERSVYADRYCFAKNAYEMGMMSLLEWNLYCDWFSWFVGKRSPLPAGFIYLRTDPRVCHRRLNKRNRSEEALVSLDYLSLLHNKHEDWLVHKRDVSALLRDIPVLVLNCDEDFESSEDLRRIHAGSVADFVVQQTGIDRSSVIAGNVLV